ncbi:probable sodium/metabolite cotransporter BASS3, chloroplastic [Dendrobium catenatum]|uniref:Putative sodium/metabolite cotransporter BASS3, chloroplastic n=1 Tax=Dendrobium catenatum TaxID=906689 RepID=A0A2I0WS44_9ASPA|nr:probable sodium/metabolite cotransporter BASS3, chloroplastic [Dendrobium catenatum]PKU78474.1 putative sodium/metabolite cotransporter BASS3, chloroplastic [Dendrobium catenatum]
MAASIYYFGASLPLLPVRGGIRRTPVAAVPLSLRIRRQRCGGGCTCMPVMACSTSLPFEGRAGWYRRKGSVTLFSVGLNTGKSGAGKDRAEAISQALSAMLPYVVAATAVASLVNPSTFSWVSKEYYAPALGGIMLSIGIKLSIDDFSLAFQRPLPLSVGYAAQYVLKPLLGLLIARAFKVPSMFYAGFILTSCVAGAQLSSYASFLSKGDVALSILLTSITTISSVIVTPLLTGLLIGSVVPVDPVAMSKSILQVVLIPVTAGLALNTYAKSVVNAIRPIMPFVALFCTALCIGSPLAINRSQILSSEGLLLLLPIVTFHIAAFALGYWASKLPFARQEPVSRTISLCTGMQSSTLAGLLATQFLGSSQAVPAACSVVVMAIVGLSLASFWGNGSRVRDIPFLFFPATCSTTNT